MSLDLDVEFQYDFRQLPTGGEVENFPWSASYWPNRKGGIARRWQKTNTTIHLNRSRVRNMSVDNIAKLSPAEKFEIYIGKYSFSLSKRERKKGYKFWKAGWLGLCHGWSAAAIREPLPGNFVVMTNPDGIRVKFYQDDIKALLTRAYAGGTEGDIFIGSRSTDWDNNPGTIHLILTNMVGIYKKSFAIDRDKKKEIWNQPIHSYFYKYGEIQLFDRRTSWRASNRNKNTKFLTDVEMTITYVDEHSGARKNPRPNKLRHLYLKYSLELDGNYNIIGGEYYPKYWVEIYNPRKTNIFSLN